MRVLDSHLHLWDPAVVTYEWLDGPLRRRFASSELVEELAGVQPTVERSFIVVEADPLPSQSLLEVDSVTSLSEGLSIRGIVARAGVERGDAVDDELDALAHRRLVVGVRRLLQDEADGFATTRQFCDGARRVARAGLTFDACVRWSQLGDVVALADAVPELSIVLDHLGKPPMGMHEQPAEARVVAWLDDLRALAERPNTWCKLSGLPAEIRGEWRAEQLWPYLDAALHAFGPERLLFGGDWPVSPDYGRWFTTVTDWLADRVSDRADAILWSNAARVYQVA
ncbi:MAG: amidohydrolase family protein [Microcella sp.]|uniref:amidohydrolase family protein n=1 Tax=Microcella sp. TaxID=1913979 RepID=UPI0024C995C6|nr:amidohydrolase family protein [Microcella sp.]UYN84817.1 MAG: amidohydrolase family protein [Microcella sp.]